MNRISGNDLAEEMIKHSMGLLRLANSVNDSCFRKQQKVKSNFRLVLSAYFARSFEIFESIILLIKNDRVTDAGVLLRSLANLIINLGYIDKNREERATLFLADGATQHLKLYKKSKNFFNSIGKSKEVEDYIRHYENEKNKLSRIILLKYPHATPWDDIKIIEKAKATQELRYVYDLLYSDLSRFEHHDFSASRVYVDPDTCNPILKRGGHRHSPVLNHKNILILSNIIFGIVLELFNGEYQLKWKEKIDEMAKKLAILGGLTQHKYKQVS
jgi:hypothetical protein